MGKRGLLLERREKKAFNLTAYPLLNIRGAVNLNYCLETLRLRKHFMNEFQQDSSCAVPIFNHALKRGKKQKTI